MKTYLIPFCLIIMIGSCKKNSLHTKPFNQNTLISKAKNYFNKTLRPITSLDQSSLRTQTAKIPQWAKASLLKLSIGQAVLVPLNYSKKLYLKSSLANKLFEVSQLAQLLIYKDSIGNLHGEVITAFPDSNYLTHPSARFTGILLVEDWSGNRLKQYKYDGYGMAMSYPAGLSGNTVAIDKISPATVIAVCYEIEGYNYTEADPDDVYSWSESAGCDFYAASDESTATGSPSGGDYGAAAGEIAFVGNDVYVAGAVYNQSISDFNAVYWKNGQLIYLADPSVPSEANGIAVLGNDVYIGGGAQETDSHGHTHFGPVYWKNGKMVSLNSADTSGNGFIFSLCVKAG